MSQLRHDYIRALIRIAERQPSEELFARIERLLAEVDVKSPPILSPLPDADHSADAGNMVPWPVWGEPPPANEEPPASVDQAIESELEANGEQLAAFGSELADVAPADDERFEAITSARAENAQARGSRFLCKKCGNHARSFAHTEACGTGGRIRPAPLTNGAESASTFDTVSLSKVAEIIPENIPTDDPTAHRHRWKIEAPDGPFSIGRCDCGATKDFANSHEALGDGSPSYWDTSKKKTAVPA